MTPEQLRSEILIHEGVLELAPQAGSDHPEVSWGDYFYYFAPDGEVPQNRQPYATIVTKDYPDDADSKLNAADRWRLNIHVGSQTFKALVGYPPESAGEIQVDFSESDVFLPHPLFGAYGWVSIVNPGPHTTPQALAALHEAHRSDRRRVERRQTHR